MYYVKLPHPYLIVHENTTRRACMHNTLALLICDHIPIA